MRFFSFNEFSSVVADRLSLSQATGMRADTQHIGTTVGNEVA